MNNWLLEKKLIFQVHAFQVVTFNIRAVLLSLQTCRAFDMQLLLKFTYFYYRPCQIPTEKNSMFNYAGLLSSPKTMQNIH